MHRVAFQIQFADSAKAADTFDSFPPDGLPYVESWMRKCHGDSQFILLELTNSSDEAKFRQLCKEFAGVTDVFEISEDACRRRCCYKPRE